MDCSRTPIRGVPWHRGSALWLVALGACAAPQKPLAQEEKMSFVQGGAGRLRVSDGGQGGVPVVLVHGLGSELETWRSVLDRLRAKRRTIAYDQRGHGQSDRAGDYSVEALADDLEQVVTALGVDRFWVVGHSFSGTVVSAYAAKHPEKVAGVIYVDAVGDASRATAEMKESVRQRDARMTSEDLKEAYGGMLGPKAKPETRNAVLGSVERMDLKAFAALRSAMGDFDGLAAAQKYPGPRFAVDAEGNDNPLMAANLPGTRRQTVGSVSHWLMLDDPEATVRALEEVLR
jgi:pimeloyl-ACP methyl ester carboxylesterase